MKLMFAGDVHGSAFYMEKLYDAWVREGAQRLVLTGDLLYHGPRNDLPCDYAPKRVIERLNGMTHSLLAVRGNCEAEVDQMVLQFPVMAEYAVLFLEGHTVFVTHGHHCSMEALPPLHPGDVFVQGHTHIHEMRRQNGVLCLNPGSVSLPKGDGVHSYLVYENGVFTSKDLEGAVLETAALE